jgi:hypothetical protein
MVKGELLCLSPLPEILDTYVDLIEIKFSIETDPEWMFEIKEKLSFC